MKKTMFIALAIILLSTACLGAQADGGGWACPTCGRYCTGNYCPYDATPGFVGGTSSTYGNLCQGGYVTFGSYKGEAIRWKILELNNGTALLLSEHAILCRPMNNNNYTSWENSDLRYWLNNEFYYTAFEGRTSYLYLVSSGDYVTIPTYNDMTNPSYGFSSNPEERSSRKCTPTSAVLREGRIYLSESGSGACGYYTRTVRKVKDDGTLIFWYVKANNTMNDTTANRTDRGVRVMIRVDVDGLPIY